MQLPLGMIVESSVSVLLVVTIGYCMILNRRLKRLHADKDTLRKMVMDLVKATDLANSAIRELKTAALEADTTLTARAEEAEKVSLEISAAISSGKSLVERIAKITSAAKLANPALTPSAAANSSDAMGGTEKVQSALQQLAMRTRIRGNAA